MNMLPSCHASMLLHADIFRCSPPTFPPDSEREEVGSAPSASATGAVSVAVAGTTPPAGITPPPATGIATKTDGL
jgi:hypothetical protein